MTTESHPWQLFSNKLKNKIEKPRHAGFFLAKEAEEKKLRLVTGKEGSFLEGQFLCLYWLVDESDGVISDAKFQVYGSAALIGAAEIISSLVIHKNYDQASRISAELIDKEVRDKKNQSGFPESCGYLLNLVLAAVDNGVEQCLNIPFAREYVATPLSIDDLPEGQIESWTELSKEQKIVLISEVMEKEIQPYVELDAGGVKVVDLKDNEVIIQYEGNCTSCHASTGSTLSAIQAILQRRIYPYLTVNPELGELV